MSNKNQATEAPEAEKVTGLEAMKAPFPESMISKLPKGTKAQNECPFEQKVRCKVCGGFHHPQMVHLDYVGHAALTQRLLQADINWSWEPLAYDEHGLPRFDDAGGLWIRLTVAGQTRLGYGDAQGKHGPNATKEAIGDALRNAAMRFGAALELWHKGDWEADTLPEPVIEEEHEPQARGGNGEDKGNGQQRPARQQPEGHHEKYVYPHFAKHEKEWRAQFASGESNPDSIIKTIKTRFLLTPELEQQIRQLAPTH